MANPFLGVFYHWIGGLAAASFYIPYRGVKRWSWETYWLVGGVFSWLVAPWLMALLLVPDVTGLLRQTPSSALFWTFGFGALWGVGGLTFGLTMRYLGIALGYAVALGLCATFGTLVPPIFEGTFGEVASSTGGRMTLLGIVVCLGGIVFSGLAGISKERELPGAEKAATVAEFNFAKGMLVAVCAGVLSSCMAFAFAAGKPLAAATKTALLAANRSDIWQGLPVLIVVLAGGFTTNFCYCVFLNIRNGTRHEYLSVQHSEGSAVPLARNYFFSALAGVTWYLQFFFYSMGQTKMGKFEFSSWTLHMASIIIFSTLWGIGLKEWRGASRRTLCLVLLGLLVLIVSTVIVGYGNYLKGG